MKTCFVEIYHNQKLVHTQSSSDEYNLGNITTEPGYYHLKVYDHNVQKQQRQLPADSIIFGGFWCYRYGQPYVIISYYRN